MTAVAIERAAVTRRLPPFGRKLAAMRAKGMAPTSAVLVIDGWAPVDNLAEYAPWVVVIPDREPADRFDFRVLAGLFVVVMASTIERMDELALRIICYTSRTAFGWLESESQLCVYPRGRE